MDKKLKLQIINLAKFVFEDVEYIKFMYYLNNNKFNDLRLFVDEKLELLDLLPKNEIILKQLQYCDELEDIVVDLYIEVMN